MIDTDEKLAEFLPELRKAEWVALDTEADSLHAYPEKLCLIQMSTPTGDWLMDPLAGIDLTEFLQTLKEHELLVHGADYDLRLFRKSYGFVPRDISDTMLAARLLGFKEFGLGTLVARFLGVTLEKGPQKANWARRPLTPRMEAYARNDTHYLKPLSDILRAQLIERNRLSWHQESCRQLIADCSALRTADPETIWRVKGSHQLSPASLAVLRELWHWRESEAISANKPPFFVLPPEAMVHLSAASAGMQSIDPILPRHLTPRRRDGVRRAIRRGLESTNLPTHVRKRNPRQTESEKRRLAELERRRNRHAAELEMDPSLIASRAMLILLSRDWDEFSGELMGWQRTLLER